MTIYFIYIAAILGVAFILGLGVSLFTLIASGKAHNAFMVTCIIGFMCVVFTCISALDLVYKMLALSI